MNTVTLILGGNIGDTLKIFKDSKRCIESQIGAVIRHSSVYESEPWGFEHSNNFYNQVLICRTLLPPDLVLKHCLTIEKLFGRKRNERQTEYQARTLDIDILFYNNEIINTSDLIIPHPHIQNRKFVLMPLSEILPNYIHPTLNEQIEILANNCPDRNKVTRANMRILYSDN